MRSQQKRNIHPTLVQRWASVADGGPTLGALTLAPSVLTLGERLVFVGI